MNQITIIGDVPYQVQGAMPLVHQHIVTNAQGDSLAWREGQTVSAPTTDRYALCRCGQSASKPFCDGAHQRVGFDGTETASREPYDVQAEHIEGPTLVLDDAKALCAFARFCDPKGQVWHLVQSSDQPAAARLVEQQAGDCPGGRLRARQREQARSGGKAIEPHFEPSIGLVQDTPRASAGRCGCAAVSRCSAPTAAPTSFATVSRCAAAGRRATSRFVMARMSHPASTTRTESARCTRWF